MEDLKLVGVHDDGEHLLLVSPSGQRFRLHADEALRAAVRRDRARLGQLQIETSGGLRPREIQARIRAGQSAEEVAEQAGVPLDHVRRYEGPVLAERQFVAEQARAVRVRRGAPAPGQPTPSSDDESLGAVVAERLSVREVDPADAEWDAWRAEDGTWTVTLEFVAGDRERRAQWSYDASVRHVAAMDDEARWLGDEEPPAASPRRLSTVRVPDEAPAAAVPDDSAATALLDTLALRRGRRVPVGGVDGPDPLREAIDTLRTAREARPEARPEARQEPRSDARPEAQPESRRGPVRLPASPRVPEAAEPAVKDDVVVLPEDAPAATAPEAKQPERASAGRSRASARGRRPSVPSWDDIVFGSRKD